MTIATNNSENSGFPFHTARKTALFCFYQCFQSGFYLFSGFSVYVGETAVYGLYLPVYGVFRSGVYRYHVAGKVAYTAFYGLLRRFPRFPLSVCRHGSECRGLYARLYDCLSICNVARFRRRRGSVCPCHLSGVDGMPPVTVCPWERSTLSPCQSWECIPVVVARDCMPVVGLVERGERDSVDGNTSAEERNSGGKPAYDGENRAYTHRGKPCKPVSTGSAEERNTGKKSTI